MQSGSAFFGLSFAASAASCRHRLPEPVVSDAKAHASDIKRPAINRGSAAYGICSQLAFEKQPRSGRLFLCRHSASVVRLHDRRRPLYGADWLCRRIRLRRHAVLHCLVDRGTGHSFRSSMVG